MTGDLVPKDLPLPERPETVYRELDNLVSKLADMRECQETIAFWTDRLEKIKAELAEAMGDATVGTVNGDKVLFYEYKQAFRSSDFAKDYPDMAKLYTRDVVAHKFDPEWLKATRPDLYEQYRVRAMRNTFHAA